MVDKVGAAEWLLMFRPKGLVIRSAVFVVMVVCFSFMPAAYAIDLRFPPLSGRVVDEAQLLRSSQEDELVSILQQHET